MTKRYKYNTVTDAIDALRKEGYTADFELVENSILSNGTRLTANDLKMEFVHRYEGPTDPADEATVYGLKTKTGTKGILVTGDGIYSEVSSPSILTQLHRSKNEYLSGKNAP